jgi:cytochrome c oxidase subunit 4
MTMTETDAQYHNDAHEIEAHLLPYRTSVIVWIVLVCLTALTVGVSQLNLARWSTAAAILIASVKASLVLLFFMGLKYDRPIFRWMFLVTALTLGIFIALTYVDVLGRF